MRTYAYLKPFGIDYFCLGRKFLVVNMVDRNLKIKYRRSFFGLFWTLLSPLAMAGIYYFVFKLVMRIQMPHYLAYVLSGVLPWTFLSASIMEGLDSLAGNAALVSKVPIPIQVFPFVGTLTNLVTLALALPILIGASLLSGVGLSPEFVMVLFYFAALFLIAYSLALILGIYFVYFRDLKHIIGLLMQLWFYATPVLYNVEMVPRKFYWIMYVNPVGMIFVALHRILSQGSGTTALEMGVTFLWVLGLTGAALAAYKASAATVAEYL